LLSRQQIPGNIYTVEGILASELLESLLAVLLGLVGGVGAGGGEVLA